MHAAILREQLAYYRARAPEYDDSLRAIGKPVTTESDDLSAKREWGLIVDGLRALAPMAEVLELACGTGIWTQELLRISFSITAIDGAPEMIELSRRKLGNAKVDYRCADLFEWEPDRQYDLVFFAFWLSHIPGEHLAAFFNRVMRATKIGGSVFIVDEPKGGRNLSGANQGDQYQQRTLRDGRTFQIIKVYYDPHDIQRELRQRGFQDRVAMIGDAFFYLCSTRTE